MPRHRLPQLKSRTRCTPLPVLLQAAAKLWPEVFATPEAEARKGELVEAMRLVRPVVETG